MDDGPAATDDQTECTPGTIDASRARLLVGVVGPCSSGKSTLARRLRAEGYRVKEIRQEHSAVPDMWLRMTNPDVLVYLDVSLEVAARREKLAKPSSWWQAERDVRLAHARVHCDCYVDTSMLTPQEVFEQISICLADSAVTSC